MHEGWIVGLALAACVALVAALLVGRRQVSMLHGAIRRALEGDLAPVSSAALAAQGSAVADYNLLARRLRSPAGWQGTFDSKVTVSPASAAARWGAMVA